MTEEWLKNDWRMTEEWLKNDWGMTEEWLKNDWYNTEEWLKSDKWFWVKDKFRGFFLLVLTMISTINYD